MEDSTVRAVVTTSVTGTRVASPEVVGTVVVGSVRGSPETVGSVVVVVVVVL